MATEEHANSSSAPAPALAPPPPAVLPPYPVMIISAIDALNEENGSNKSSISKQIESTYGYLLPTHSTLLTHHLNRMKSAGELVFLKNNYLKPDPNTPPRRGRGRPPKPKTGHPASGVPSALRPRGRPPKSSSPNAPPASPKPSANLSGRKRGRPPKATSEETAEEVYEVGTTSVPVADASPRGRGRPPKVKPAVAASVGA